MAQRRPLAGKIPQTVQRLELWRRGLGSSLRRYGGELVTDAAGLARAAGSMGAAAAAGPTSAGAALPFAESWRAAPSGPGLTAAAWLGHCSVLLKLDGLTILTDPVLSPRIGVRLGPIMIGPRRLGPALPSAALPEVDVLLISHAHYDHLDKPTLRALADSRTTVVTAQNTRRLIPRGFGDVVEVPWNDRFLHRGLLLQALRPQHWGARTAWDRHRGFNSYLITTESSGSRLLFAGDTAMTDAYTGIGPLNLAIMGIGAYRPWVQNHATPEQALEMAGRAGAACLLPVHHSTYRLSDEPIDEPMRRLLTAAAGSGVRVLEAPVGEVVHLPSVGAANRT